MVTALCRCLDIVKMNVIINLYWLMTFSPQVLHLAKETEVLFNQNLVNCEN